MNRATNAAASIYRLTLLFFPAGSFYYDGNHRYIFPGAEIPPEEESDDSSDDGSSEDGADADPGKTLLTIDRNEN